MNLDWLGNALGYLGNLFFGGGKNDDEERRRQQQQRSRQSQAPVQQPQSNQAAPMQQQSQQPQAPALNLVKQPEEVKPKAKTVQQQPKPRPQAPVLNMFNPADNALVKGVQFRAPQVQPQPRQAEPSTTWLDLGKSLVSGVQQGTGKVADVALQGGSLISQLSNMINPFVSQDKRDQLVRDEAAASEARRRELRKLRDVSGASIEGTSGADESAGRIAAGQGSARDFAEVAGQSLDTSIAATQFINPSSLVKGAVRGAPRQIGKTIAQDSALFGGTGGTSSALNTYADTGDIGQATIAGIEGGAADALTQGALEGGAYGFGRMLRKGLPNEVEPGIGSANPTFEADAAQQVAEAQARAQRPVVGPNAAPEPLAVSPESTSSVNEPAFVRQRVQEAIDQDVLDATPPDITDIPAYQRQGRTLPSTATKQARIDELSQLVDSAPSSSELRAMEYRLREQYANDLRENPHLKKQLNEKLKNNLDSLKADSSVVDAAKTERDALMSEISTEQQQAKVAKSLQAEATAIPSKPATGMNVGTKTVPTNVTQSSNPTIPKFTPAEPKSVPVAPKTAPVAVIEQKAVQAPSKPAKAPKKTPQSELPAATVGNIAKTGEISKSKGKYARGQEYEKTSQAASQARGESEAANTSFKKLTEKVDKQGSMSGAERDTAVALQKRFKPGSEEHRVLGNLVNKYHTEAAQTLGTIERTIRRTADPKQLTDRFANKLYKNLGDEKSISDSDFDSVMQKNTDFATARDARDTAIEKFNDDPSETNANTVVDAFNKMDAADRAARFEEYKVASRSLKGNNTQEAKDAVRRFEKDAGVYTMDWVDSSMLSSTRVMLNNFINTVGARGEEALFGKTAAALARRLTGTDIGGGSIRGGRLGAKLGDRQLMTDAKLRQGANGNALVKGVKNFSTTGNTLGERNIHAAAYSGIYDHYRTQLKKSGYKGDELERRALVNSLADPDGVVDGYMNQALADNAMSSVVNGKNSTKIEMYLTEKMADKLGGSALAKNGSKAIMRTVLGFPTVVIRSLQQGVKRSTFGSISAVQAAKNAISGGDKEVTARLIKNSVKELGSGATMVSIGAALGSAGLISGSYPTDKDERDAWKREGKTENAIKIGDSWYGLPSALGIFALPFMLGANAGQNAREDKPFSEDFAQSTVSTLINSMPVDSLSNTIDFVNDLAAGKDVSKYLTQTSASLTKVATPLGSLLSQIAKAFDPTANDTTKGEAIEQFVAKVQSGIPFLANQLPDKMVEGNVVENPNPLATFLGAQTKEQGVGVQTTADIQKQLDSATKTLSDYGVFNDKIRNIITDANVKTIFDKMKSGEKIDQSEMKKVLDSITKGVDKGSDTRFLEDGDYDNNLAVLKVKRDLLAADPTTRRSDIDDYDKQIKRGEIYKKSKVPYDLIEKYQSIDLSEWRDMGDPESDEYNADLYQKLFDLDKQMTDSSVSRNSKDASKARYYAKESKAKKGRGGSRANANAAGGTLGSPVDLKNVDFGNLKSQKTVTPIPQVQRLKSTDLVKKRTISVGRR